MVIVERVINSNLNLKFKFRLQHKTYSLVFKIKALISRVTIGRVSRKTGKGTKFFERNHFI